MKIDMLMPDRWLVSSWGRSGSTVTTELLHRHIHQVYGQSSEINWESLVLKYRTVKMKPFTVYHSHSLSQLNIIPNEDNCETIFCVRNPSESALSMLLADIFGVYNKRNPDWIEKIKEKLNDPNEVDNYDTYLMNIKEFEKWESCENVKINLDITVLDYYRQNCITFNQLSIKKLNTIKSRVKYVNYADWQGDLNLLTKLLNIDPVDITLMGHTKNTRSWNHHVENIDELQNWLDLHINEDKKYITSWHEELYS